MLGRNVIKMIKGKGVSVGIGFGNIVILKNEIRKIEKNIVEDSDKELERFHKALEEVINETNQIVEKARGTEKEIIVNRQETCTECNGTGAKKGTSPIKCPTCNGTGNVTSFQNTILGRVQTTRPCSECRGTGEIIKEPCENCRGKGTVRKQPKIKVKIPAGIDDNQTVVLRGEGEPGKKGGPKGDLYITVKIKRNSIYTRKGNNVF